MIGRTRVANWERIKDEFLSEEKKRKKKEKKRIHETVVVCHYTRPALVGCAPGRLTTTTTITTIYYY
ncbi:hypothetical protein ANTQUA_LOCUS9937 [Anthophora quadrimaculata]